MLMSLCSTCSQPPRFIRVRPETHWWEYGVEYVDEGLIGICACDHRYPSAVTHWDYSPPESNS